MYENLKFRRQFLLTKAPVTPLPDWKCLQLDEYYLYAHPDLEVNRAADTKKRIVLIGSMYDPDDPGKGNADILHDILGNTKTMDALVKWIKRYAGIYALLYIDDEGAFLQHDALGLREIYYFTKNNKIVCGSQPNLIAKFASPEVKPMNDPDFLEFYSKNSKDLRWNPYRKWIGDETYYEGIKHLLPNHYLDITKC